MNIKNAVLATAGVLGAFGLLATPSMGASPHFLTTGGPTKGVGEEQTVSLDPFHITCEKAKPKGYVEAGEPKTITVELEPKKCRTAAKLNGSEKYDFSLKTKFASKFVIEYHANGFVEAGSELEGAEPMIRLKGGAVEIRVPALHDAEGQCIVTIPEQTLPTKAESEPEGEYPDAVYSNEEVHKGRVSYQRLHIVNNFSRVQYEYGGGQCEEFEDAEETRKGKIAGEFFQEVLEKHSLEWVG